MLVSVKQHQLSSVQWLSRVWLFAIPWIASSQASLSITISRSSLKFTSIESVMPSSHLILCCPFFLLFPIPPSIRVFSNESTLHIRWPKYWSFSFSIIPSKEIPGLISFRMDWLDLAVQGTLKSLLQHHSSKASILRCSAFSLSLSLSLSCFVLQYCIGFAIHWHESTMGVHEFPFLNPPPTSHPISSLWVIPMHQPQASSILYRI